MQAASEAPFPYGWPGHRVCYFTIVDDYPVPMQTRDDMRNELRRKQPEIYAVWPGEWRSDMFFIDDVDKLKEALGSSCLPPQPPPKLAPSSSVVDGRCRTTVVFTQAEYDRFGVARAQLNWRVTCPGCGREGVMVNDFSGTTRGGLHQYSLRAHPPGAASWADVGGHARCGRPKNNGEPCQAILGVYQAACQAHSTPEERETAVERARASR